MKSQRRFVSAGPWIISAISLFLALTSVAGALPGTNTVDSGDIRPQAVHPTDIAPGAVHGPQIADAAVGPNQIANAAVRSNQIANSAVGSNKIAAGAVGPGEIGHHAIISDNIDDRAITGRKLSDVKLMVGFEGFVGLHPGVGATASQTCPNGSRLIGGGALTTGDNGIIQSSYPDPGSASPGPNQETKIDPTTWTAQGSLTGGSGFMQVYALCLD